MSRGGKAPLNACGEQFDVQEDARAMLVEKHCKAREAKEVEELLARQGAEMPYVVLPRFGPGRRIG